ncbi:Transposon Tf2-8 polyprotein [Vitis vinifera]|uniref:Transposon Tf2-8 polyprotein n=1 Tax=Vitis vinifera TaxID=29760 RepID=A0A438DV13_VITVI|nr:Transposon Tf2-8 polyprotein [Vitis vinifera]
MGQRHHGLHHRATQVGGQRSIIVVVDRFSKYATFIAAPTDCTAEETARLFLKHVVKYWGLPKFIISDRDPRFTGKFWTELFKLMGSELHFSTSFHPQTDGQTERPVRASHRAATVNSSHSNDWLHGEKSSGFQVRKGWHEQADIARSYLDKAAKKMKKWADKKRRHTEYKVGDMVLVKLLPQQFKSLRPVHKGLVRRYEGPFPILGKVGKTGSSGDEVPPATEYLVKWKGLPESEASWEPAEALWQFQSRSSGSGQKARRGRLRHRWGECHKLIQMSLPMALYRARKLLETPRVGRVWKVLEKLEESTQFYTMVEGHERSPGFLENLEDSCIYLYIGLTRMM